ncbi:beta-parvin [Suricata suricatta]|uniref:beta-parvin n=1 Tax=Suricata suricatta TaxID=37032 RepID=UPI001155C3DF|nr:beta-parvin [Suricata suricatta]
MGLVTDLQEEGRHAINSPMSPASADVHPEDTLLEENEERTMIDPTSKDDPKFKELVKVLIDWINDVLAEERIIVKQLEEDLYDGQVLQKLLEKLAGCKLNVAEVTQSEIGQKQKLQTVLEAVHGLLRPHGWPLRWAVDSIHGKNLVAILHLLVSLAMHFRAPIRLPEHVSVQVVVVRKREGLLHSSHVTEELTTTTEMMMGRFERDAFDTLFDHAPDKLSVVKKSLITFVNKHLNKLNLEVTELETQFADGVYLVLLMGLLEDYFVPLHNFYLTPESFDQKVRAWSPSSGRPRTRVSPRTAWSMPPVALLGVAGCDLGALPLCDPGGGHSRQGLPGSGGCRSSNCSVPLWTCRRAGPGSGALTPGAVSLFPSADVVNLDLKSTLRVLYNLFTKYKNLE